MAAAPAHSKHSANRSRWELTVNGRLAVPVPVSVALYTGHANPAMRQADRAATSSCLLIAAYTSVYQIPLNVVPSPVLF